MVLQVRRGDAAGERRSAPAPPLAAGEGDEQRLRRASVPRWERVTVLALSSSSKTKYFVSPLSCPEAEIPADEAQEIRLHLQDSPLRAAHGAGDGRRERAAHPAG